MIQIEYGQSPDRRGRRGHRRRHGAPSGRGRASTRSWSARASKASPGFASSTPDVLVLDLMLPARDGWSIIESARAEGIPTPIVVVSARGTEHDRVHALEIGADDYLVKPFSMKELVARVRAASRTGASPRRRATRRADRDRGAAHRPARRPGVRRRRKRGAHSDRVSAALPARARTRASRHPRRAAAEDLGPAREPPGPHRRRLRPTPARQDRPPRLAAHVHPDPLRRRLPASSQLRRS